MSDDNEKQFAPLPPYDESLEESYNLYDKMPYELDINLCGRHGIKMNSGNLLKYYRCKTKETYKVNNQDDRVRKLLEEERQRLSMHPESEIVEEDSEPELTPEQIENLLKEQQEEQDI